MQKQNYLQVCCEIVKYIYIFFKMLMTYLDKTKKKKTAHSVCISNLHNKYKSIRGENTLT